MLLRLLFGFAGAGGHASREQKAKKLQCTPSVSNQTIKSKAALPFAVPCSSPELQVPHPQAVLTASLLSGADPEQHCPAHSCDLGG